MSDDSNETPSTQAALLAGGARGSERQTLVALDQTPRASELQQTDSAGPLRQRRPDASNIQRS